MTRRDLEEAIVNLEYLVSKHFDPAKTQEYEQQLQVFRRELEKQDQEQYSLGQGRNHHPRWRVA